MNRVPSPRLLLFLIPFSVSFIVYLFTLSPTVGLEDSGEFIAAVYSLGVAHPSGYPLYVVLGKLFTLLVPVGDIAWRVNLFSAFCASATVGLFSLFLADILSSLFLRQQGTARDGHSEASPISARGLSEAVTAPALELADRRDDGAADSRVPQKEIARGERNAASFRATTLSVCLVAASLSLAFAFSPVFWSQAVVAEVYTLNAFFVVATLFLLWRYECSRRPSTLYAFALVYSLSLNNHQTMLLLAPVYLLFLLLADKKLMVDRMKKCLGGLAGMVSRRSGTSQTESQAASRAPGGMTAPFSAANPSYLIAFFVFLLGLSFYFLVLFRAGQDPLLNWDHPQTLERLWRHFTRQSYNDFSNSLWGDLWQMRKVIYAHFFFTDLLAQITLPASFLALIGFLTLWFRKRALFTLTFGVFLFNSLAIVFLRKIGYHYEAEQIYRVYYIPAYLVTFLWAGLGMLTLVQGAGSPARMQRFLSRRVLTILGVALLAAFPLFLGIGNFYANDKSGFWLARDWGVSLLESLAPDAVLMLHNEQPAADSQIFIITYLMLVENLRPDVAVVDAGYLSSRFYHPAGPDLEEIARLPLHLFRSRLLNRVWNVAREIARPVYAVYPVGAPALNGDLMGRSNGLAVRVYPNNETARLAKPPHAMASLRNMDDPRLEGSSYGRDFLSEIHYARAAWYLEQGHFKISETALIEAFNLDQTPLSANTYDYMAYRARWLEVE